MNELSIFIDESGDFGEYSNISPYYYIVALVIHHQEADISAQLQQLESSLAGAGFPQHCIHAGPIIRRENEYAYEDLSTRQGLLKKLMAFIRHVDIEYTTIHIEKKHVHDSVDAAGKLSKQLSRFISKSELLFFGNERTLKKNYLKPLDEKRIQ